jgi:hypothetical protein
MLGVLTIPPATPPPFRLISFQPRSSATIRMMLGGVAQRLSKVREG